MNLTKKIVAAIAIACTFSIHANSGGISELNEFKVIVSKNNNMFEIYEGAYAILQPYSIESSRDDGKGKETTKISLAGNNSGVQLFYVSSEVGGCDVFSKESKFHCITSRGAKVEVTIDK